MGRKLTIVATFSLFFFLSGCATYTLLPQNPENRATYHVKKARKAISKGACRDATYEIELALFLPTGDEKIRELFASNQEAQDCYFSHLEEEIGDISKPYGATLVFETLSIAKSAQIFPENQIGELFADLNKIVTEGNKTGAIPFILGDNIDFFPELKSPEHQRFMVDRAIIETQGDGSGKRRVIALMKYVQRVGVASDEGKRIESLLPTMRIGRDELDVVEKVFPEFAAVRRDELTTRVFLQMKNGDRLLKEDLLEVFRKRIRGVEWVPSADRKMTTLVIEQLRHDEKTLSERTQTVTYAAHEVNLLGAVLLMPRNASYLYDVVSGGAEIEYGYVVSAILDDKVIYDELIRGKASGEYRRCQNARIRNVFGGVSAARFVANQDMEDRCAGPNSVSMEDLRQEIFSHIADGVLDVPPIKSVHSLNPY